MRYLVYIYSRDSGLLVVAQLGVSAFGTFQGVLWGSMGFYRLPGGSLLPWSLVSVIVGSPGLVFCAVAVAGASGEVVRVVGGCEGVAGA